jgi:hypothetical protein
MAVPQWLNSKARSYCVSIHYNEHVFDPVSVEIAGHFVLGAVMTPLLMFAICWMAFHTDRRVRMGPVASVALVASSVVILACVGANFVTPMSDHSKAAAAPQQPTADPSEAR